jgi:hypothetical protein
MMTTTPASLPVPCCARCDRGYDATVGDLCELCAAADETCACCGGIGQQADGDDCPCIRRSAS